MTVSYTHLLGMTQEEMAERIGRVPKYYADIERGSCGMSVETLMAVSYTHLDVYKRQTILFD